MRVGIVSEWSSRGSGYVGRQYASVLEAQGCRVFIYARGDQEPLTSSSWKGQNVHRAVACRNGKPKAIYAPDFRRWIKDNQLEIVLFNEQQWFPPVLWARQLGVKTAAYIDYYRVKDFTLFEWYDILICNTSRHFAAFGWHSGAHFIPWGTDLNEFAPRLRPDRPITFVHSAGWDPARKATRQVIKAWSALKPGTDLVLHSQADISSLINSDDLKERIKKGQLKLIGGTVPQNELLPLGDVYVYPTTLEGIGLTVPESLACGLPVIVPDDGPMNEFILEGISRAVPIQRRWRREDGYYWLCNEVSEDHLIKAMEFFASSDINSVANWVSETRLAALKQLDWERNAMGLAELLRRSPIRVVDRDIANSQVKVRATISRFFSLIGRIASIVIGERIIGKN